MIRKVNSAYRVLLDYVTEYRFSFVEGEFYEQNRRLGDGCNSAMIRCGGRDKESRAGQLMTGLFYLRSGTVFGFVFQESRQRAAV